MSGLAFKIGAFPFQIWVPDVYQGAPTPVTAFLAVASKAAGFVALTVLLFVCFQYRPDVFQPLMWTLATATRSFLCRGTTPRPSRSPSRLTAASPPSLTAFARDAPPPTICAARSSTC